MTNREEVLKELADGVWVTSAPVRFLGLRLTATMTVLRLGGDLLVHSPVALTPQTKRAVDALGRVAHLYAPNAFHHLRLGSWAAAYPEASIHAPPSLVKKRPDLRIDRIHGSALDPALIGIIDELRIAGFRLDETVLFHRPSKTLVLADLVHNIGRPEHGWTRIYTRMMGFYDRVALSRMIRWTAFSDRHAARRSVDDVLALPLERIVVGHGSPIVDEPRVVLAEAYAWLSPKPLLGPAATEGRGRRIFSGCA